MTKKIKIITLATVLTLSLGYAGFYQWAKSRFLDNHQAIVKTLEKDGFTIQDNTPITFSGFPFKIIAHQEKFTAIRASHKISSTNTHITVSMLNPLELDIKGNIQVQRDFTTNAFFHPYGTLTKKTVNINIGWSFNIIPYHIKYDMKSPHVILKFDSSPESILLKSIKFHEFEGLLDNTLYQDIIKISGKTAKYTYTPTEKSTADGEYELTLKQINITKYDTQSKWAGSVAIPHWTLKLDIKKAQTFQKYWAAVRANFLEDLRKSKADNSKLSAEQTFCRVAPHLFKPIGILNEPDSSLEVESKIKRGEETIDFKVTLFTEYKKPKLKSQELMDFKINSITDNENPKLKIYAKTDKAHPFFVDLVNILAQPSPESLENFKERLAAKKSSSKNTGEAKIDVELDLIEQAEPFISLFCDSKHAIPRSLDPTFGQK